MRKTIHHDDQVNSLVQESKKCMCVANTDQSLAPSVSEAGTKKEQTYKMDKDRCLHNYD